MNKYMIKCLIFSFLLLFSFKASSEQRMLEDVIEEVNPSVVNIVVDTDDENQVLGAGIIISADGYIVTNAHVTENAKNITITTADGEEYQADLKGSDNKTDISLLRVVHPLGFEPAHFADSEEVRVGNTVFAIGNPFGLGNSVSLGIISAKERDIEKGPYDNFLQTDAAINQGNSGGPLFNMEGQIVGLNTAIFSTDGKNMGVGFATPSNIVQWVAEQLKKNGKIVRGWLGIGVQKLRTDDAEQKDKLFVASMSEDSPAALSGIKVGDILEAVGEATLRNPRDFSLSIASMAPGTTLPVTVIRDGKTLDFEVTVLEMPEKKTDEDVSENMLLDAENSTRPAVNFSELGMKMYFDDVSQEFVVLEIEDKSDAAVKGIRVGDRFKTFNNQKVFGVEDLKIKLREAKETGKATLLFVSDDAVDTITLNLR